VQAVDGDLGGQDAAGQVEPGHDRGEVAQAVGAGAATNPDITGTIIETGGGARWCQTFLNFVDC
jgi:hypothetical protein